MALAATRFTSSFHTRVPPRVSRRVQLRAVCLAKRNSANFGDALPPKPTKTSLLKRSKAELEADCIARGLANEGLKTELVDRLLPVLLSESQLGPSLMGGANRLGAIFELPETVVPVPDTAEVAALQAEVDVLDAELTDLAARLNAATEARETEAQMLESMVATLAELQESWEAQMLEQQQAVPGAEDDGSAELAALTEQHRTTSARVQSLFALMQERDSQILMLQKQLADLKTGTAAKALSVEAAIVPAAKFTPSAQLTTRPSDVAVAATRSPVVGGDEEVISRKATRASSTNGARPVQQRAAAPGLMFAAGASIVAQQWHALRQRVPEDKRYIMDISGVVAGVLIASLFG